MTYKIIHTQTKPSETLALEKNSTNLSKIEDNKVQISTNDNNNYKLTNNLKKIPKPTSFNSTILLATAWQTLGTNAFGVKLVGYRRAKLPLSAAITRVSLSFIAGFCVGAAIRDVIKVDENEIGTFDSLEHLIMDEDMSILGFVDFWMNPLNHDSLWYQTYSPIGGWIFDATHNKNGEHKLVTLYNEY